MKKKVFTALVGLTALFLVLTAAFAQDVQPLPFSFITVDGRVWVPRPNSSVHRLSFDVDFRLHQLSNGLEAGDSCTIQTQLAYPTMAPNQEQGPSYFWTLPLVRMILRVHVAENCFMATDDGGFRFRLNDNNRSCLNAVLDLAEVGLSDVKGSGLASTYLDLTPIVKSMEIAFKPRDRMGRWRMTSKADFMNPGYPFPVVGFGNIPGQGPAATVLIIGDDGGAAPFGGMVFEGSSGDDVGPCQPISHRVQGQGFWKRQCKGPHPAGERLEDYVDIIRLTETFASVEDGEGICRQLSPAPRSDKCEQAEGQFMAMLLNLASGRLAPCNCVEDPLLGTMEVSEVMHYLDELLASPDRTRADCERAKSIADRINRGESLVDCDQLE